MQQKKTRVSDALFSVFVSLSTPLFLTIQVDKEEVKRLNLKLEGRWAAI